VLEHLGVRLGLDPERASKVLEQAGIVFLFAPAHHPSMKAVGAARKALGIRTVFNQLGPLANPARAKRQLVGVYEESMVQPMAEALKIMGADRVMVVHGLDGLDEISPCAETDAVELRNGELVARTFSPADFGIAPLAAESILPGADVSDNANLLVAAISGADAPRASALVPNSATALYLAGLADTIADGAEIARRTIESGRAADKLKELVEATRSA
jgi:anthranilate phosphoribosyltransferase